MEQTLALFDTSSIVPTQFDSTLSTQTIASYQTTDVLIESNLTSQTPKKPLKKSKADKITSKRKRNENWPKLLEFPISELPDALISKLTKRLHLIESDYRKLIEGFYYRIVNEFNM